MSNTKIVFILSKIKKKDIKTISQKYINDKIIFLRSDIQNQLEHVLENKEIFLLDDFFCEKDLENIRKLTKQILEQWFIPIKYKIIFDGILFSDIDYYQLHLDILKNIKVFIALEKLKQKYSGFSYIIFGKDKILLKIIQSFFKQKEKSQKYFISGFEKIVNVFILLIYLFKNYLRNIFLKKDLSKDKNQYSFFNFDLNKYNKISQLAKTNCNGKICFCYKSYKTSLNVLNQGLDSYFVYKFFKLTKLEFNKIYQFFYDILSEWNNFIIDDKTKKLFTLDANNIDMRYVFSSVLFKHIFKYYIQYIIFLHSIRNFYKQKTIKGIFVWNDELWMEKLCVLEAKKQRILSCVIQHGAIGDSINNKPLYADILALWGNSSREFYKNIGVKEDNMKIVGSIQCDNAIDVKKNISDDTITKIKESLNISVNEKIILFPILPEYKHREIYGKYKSDEASKLFNIVTNVSSKYNNIKVIVKCRTKQDFDLYKKWGRNKKNIIYVYDINIYDLISVCDFVISYFSTIGLEAMFFSKLTIIANFSEEQESIPYVSMNAVLYADTIKKLDGFLQELLINNNKFENILRNQKKFLQEYIYKNDGLTSNRLLNFLDGIGNGENLNEKK